MNFYFNFPGMLHSLDESVGKVIDALVRTNLMEDTIIMYFNDNGGPTAMEITHPTTANNFPLRSVS